MLIHVGELNSSLFKDIKINKSHRPAGIMPELPVGTRE